MAFAEILAQGIALGGIPVHVATNWGGMVWTWGGVGRHSYGLGLSVFASALSFFILAFAFAFSLPLIAFVATFSTLGVVPWGLLL